VKKILSFFLIAIFAINIFGAFFIYKVQQAKIRYEASLVQNYNEKDLVHIIITNDNLHLLNWQREGEFSFKGHFYDIVDYYVENDTIIHYNCIPDVKETKLLADYKKVENQGDKTSKKSSKSAKRSLKQFNQIYYTSLNGFYAILKEKHEYKSYQQKIYKNPTLDILLPPPKFIS